MSRKNINFLLLFFTSSFSIGAARYNTRFVRSKAIRSKAIRSKAIRGKNIRSKVKPSIHAIKKPFVIKRRLQKNGSFYFNHMILSEYW